MYAFYCMQNHLLYSLQLTVWLIISLLSRSLHPQQMNKILWSNLTTIALSATLSIQNHELHFVCS